MLDGTVEEESAPDVCVEAFGPAAEIAVVGVVDVDEGQVSVLETDVPVADDVILESSLSCRSDEDCANCFSITAYSMDRAIWCMSASIAVAQL